MLRKPKGYSALRRAKKSIDLVTPKRLNPSLAGNLTTSKKHRKFLADTVKSFRKEGNKSAAKKTILHHGAVARRHLMKNIKGSHFGQLWNAKSL